MPLYIPPNLKSTRLTQGAGLFVASGTYPILDFSVVNFDDNGWFNPSDPSKITPNAGDRVLIGAQLIYIKNTTGAFGAMVINSAGTSIAQASGYCAVIGENRAVSISAITNVTVGDFFQMQVYSFSGVGDNLIGIETRFWAVKLK